VEADSDKFAEEIAEEIKEMNKIDTSEHITDKLARYYQIKDGTLYQKYLSRGNRTKEQVVMKMSDQTHFQKVVTVPQGDKNERVFLIGGSSDDQGNHAVDTCTELVYSKKKPHLQDITSMLVPRLSFCSCVS